MSWNYGSVAILMYDTGSSVITENFLLLTDRTPVLITDHTPMLLAGS